MLKTIPLSPPLANNGSVYVRSIPAACIKNVLGDAPPWPLVGNYNSLSGESGPSELEAESQVDLASESELELESEWELELELELDAEVAGDAVRVEGA